MKTRLLSTARLSFPLATAIAALLAMQSAQATTYYWDDNNGTSGFGATASGTWAAPTTGTATAGWSTSATGVTAISGNSVTTGIADILNFGTDTSPNGLGGGTITVSGTVDATQLRFGNQSFSNILITGGTINLAAAGNIHVGAGSSTVMTVASNITGAGTSLTKTGNSLVLSGNNTYSGSTLISTGTLFIGSANAVANTSGITIGGAATATLANNADINGFNITAPITAANSGINSTISFGRSTAAQGTFTLSGGITGGAGNVIFTTPNVSSGGNVQTIVLGGGVGSAGGYGGTTSLGVGNANNSITLRSGIANALPTTTVLTFSQNNGTGSGRTTVFDLNGNNQTLAGLSNTGVVPECKNMTVTSAAAATLTINSTANQTFGGRTISTVTSTIGTNTRAQISGAISLIKSGSGTFTLGGTLAGGAVAAGNSFTGTTKILGGILVLGESLSIQNSAFDTTSVLGGASDGLRAGIGGTGVTTLTLGGLTGGNDFSTRFTTTGGYTNLTNLTLNPGAAATPSYGGDVGNGNGSMTLTKAGLGTQTFTIAQSYSGGTNINNGTLALSGTGTLGATGTALTLGGGSLDLGTLSQTVGAVSVTAAAASGDTISNGSLTGTSYAASNTTGTAIISANLLANGAAGFAVSGAGGVSLSGNNTYSGGTSVTSTGALNLAHSNAAGSNAISLASTQSGTAATFTLSGGIDVANGIQIDALTGRENIASLSGSNTLSGNITINNNAANFIVFTNNGAAATTFTVGGAVPNSTTITGSTYSSTISFRATGGTDRLGVINSQINAPSAIVDVNNTGNWTINSTGNIWATTNITSVAGGILKLGANDAIATGANLNVNTASGSNGYLDMNGKNQQLAGLTGGNATTPTVHIDNKGAADSTLTLAGLTANRSFAGIIADGGAGKTIALTMNSAGRTQTLTGANTYSGATSVNAGTLALGASNVLPDASPVAIGTATLDAATFTDTLGTLDATGAAVVNLGSGGALAFADSSAVDWTGGALDITGTFVSGSSIRFGTSNTALTAGQLAVISVNNIGVGTYSLDSNGYLISSGPGPVDHFVISAIIGTKTVGTAITGITLTAQDASNATATGFTGTVTFGGTGGFTGTSANFVAGVLNSVSVIPANAGSNLTFTVDDGASHTGTTTITTIQTQFDAWSGGAAFDADSNGDGVKNGLAWLLGAADKDANANSLLPVPTESAGKLVMTFDCLSTANRGSAALNLQYSKDLGIADLWNSHEAAVPGAVGTSTVSGVDFTATANGALIHVVAEVPASAASPGTALFGRLDAVNTP